MCLEGSLNCSFNGKALRCGKPLGKSFGFSRKIDHAHNSSTTRCKNLEIWQYRLSATCPISNQHPLLKRHFLGATVVKLRCARGDGRRYERSPSMPSMTICGTAKSSCPSLFNFGNAQSGRQAKLGCGFGITGNHPLGANVFGFSSSACIRAMLERGRSSTGCTVCCISRESRRVFDLVEDLDHLRDASRDRLLRAEGRRRGAF